MDVIAPWHHLPMPTVEDMCPCEPMPVMVWIRGGEALVREMEGADPEADAALYNAGGWEQWVICCPQCEKVYVAGRSK